MGSRFYYFIGKSSNLIYRLCIGKGTAKERLIECEHEIHSMLLTPIPDDLRVLRDQIKNRLFDSGVREGEISLTRSMFGKRNSTASKIIKDIYDLHQKVVDYVEFSIKN
jgi:hypothetical protein